jgi:hypothetical protein
MATGISYIGGIYLTTTAHRIHSELHIAAIRLAGKIYGDYARTTAREKDTREKRTQ